MRTTCWLGMLNGMESGMESGMAAESSSNTRRKLPIGVAGLVAVAVLAVILFAVSRSQESAAPPDAPTPTPTAAAEQKPLPPLESPPPESPTPQKGASAEPDTDLTLGLPSTEDARDLEPAPLGTYVVAREGAGIRRGDNADETPAPLEIPVYDEPFGQPRVLLDSNEIDGVDLPVELTNWDRDEGALVMRVIAGGPDDDWLMVQAPTRPHNRFVWVRAGDFDLGFTNQRIEIDLAGEGELVLYDGEQALLRSPIVQGRDSRPTPVHLTFLEGGIGGDHVPSPAYGSALLSIASFSEVLGTFGGGGMPSNFIHGTNQPGLMGQRVSSGEIRIPNDVINQLVQMSGPGTPVLLFDSSNRRPGRDEILAEQPLPATTVSFLHAKVPGLNDARLATPQLWRRCDPAERAAENELLCSMQVSHSYLVAKDGAGVVDPVVGGNVIPVFDEPDGSPRTLVFDHPAIGFPVQVPLLNPTPSGQPLVLLPIEPPTSDGWVRVLAPTFPARQAVWVRTEHFDAYTSDLRIEIDIAGPGELRLYNGEEEILTSPIVSGRESRPTPLGVAYVDAILDGPSRSPAYGPYIVSVPLFNEQLGTFGGGMLAMQQIHGTDQPGLFGQRVASGHIRVPNDVMSALAEDPRGLIGALVITFDSSDGNRSASIEREQLKPWSPAETIAAGTADFPTGERPN